jgi:hypothetical protein
MKPKRYRYSKIFRAIFTFVGFVYNEIIHNEGAIFIVLKRTRKRVKCPACGGRNRLLKDFYKGTVRDLDVCPKDCYLTFFETKLK